MRTIYMFLIAVFSFTACSNPEKKEFSVNAKVESIQFGKDGYTASIQTADGKKYDAVISRINLKDPAQYRELKPGEEAEFSGDTLTLGDKISIRVLSLH